MILFIIKLNKRSLKINTTFYILPDACTSFNSFQDSLILVFQKTKKKHKANILFLFYSMQALTNTTQMTKDITQLSMHDRTLRLSVRSKIYESYSHILLQFDQINYVKHSWSLTNIPAHLIYDTFNFLLILYCSSLCFLLEERR